MSPLELVADAARALTANKLRSFLTTLGVVIGVLSVVLLVSLGEGMRDFVADSFLGLGTNIVQVFAGKRETRGMGPLPSATTRKLTLEEARRLRQRLPSLDGVSALLVASAEIRHGARRRDVALVGGEETFPQVRQVDVESGRFYKAEEVAGHRRVVVLGARAAIEVFGDENPLHQEVRVGGVSCLVVGVLLRRGVTLGIDLDDQVYMPVTTTMDILAVDGLGSILIRARGRFGVSDAITEVADLLRQMHGGQEDFTVVSQDDLLGTLSMVLQTLSLVLLGIATVALIVSGIGIANIMLVTVSEREREIGLRRAVGAKRRHILGQFLAESALIAALGGAVGLALATGLIVAARVLAPELPVQLSLSTLLLGLGLAVLVGITAGVVPALRASRLDPAEALRAP